MKKRILTKLCLLVLLVVLYFLVEDKVVLGILFIAFFAYVIFDDLKVGEKERVKTPYVEQILIFEFCILRTTSYVIFYTNY
jgi:hypothetical protein